MGEIKYKPITPEELHQDLDSIVSKHKENKYAFQIGLRDLDFDVNHDLLKANGLSLPFPTIDHAEQALEARAIQPLKFIEEDGTEHQVLAFDYRPVGFSGFMDCVTHSLAITNHGLFEIGRYSAVSLAEKNKYWQWFIHRRLASREEVNRVMESDKLTPENFIEEVRHAMLNG